MRYQVSRAWRAVLLDSSRESSHVPREIREIRGLFGVFAKVAGVLIGCPLAPDSLSDWLRRVA
jgi:hypothetical protein